MNVTTLPYTTTSITTTTLEEEIEETTTVSTTPIPPIEPTEEPATTLPEPSETPIFTISTKGLTLEPKLSTDSPDSSSSAETNIIQPHRILQCSDHGRYCKWWRIHHLCENDRVRKLCQLSCLPECSF